MSELADFYSPLLSKSKKLQTIGIYSNPMSDIELSSVNSVILPSVVAYLKLLFKSYFNVCWTLKCINSLKCIKLPSNV